MTNVFEENHDDGEASTPSEASDIGEFFVETIRVSVPDYIPSRYLAANASKDLTKYLLDRGVNEETLREAIRHIYGDTRRAKEALGSKSIRNPNSPHWFLIAAWNQLALAMPKATSTPVGPRVYDESEKKAIRQWYAMQGRPGSPYERFPPLAPGENLAAQIDWAGSPEEAEVLGLLSSSGHSKSEEKDKGHCEKDNPTESNEKESFF